MNGELYKYCPVYDHENLENEWSLINLFNNHVKFSTRKSFNDLFDSKIDFLKPTKKQLKQLYPKVPERLKSTYSNSMMTQYTPSLFDKLVSDVNHKFDTYLIYCVTTDPCNNLMWSHYASNHTGFCIEWKKGSIPANKVNYCNKIAEFPLIDIVKSNFEIIDHSIPAEKISNALLVKLDEWNYENEYRLILGNDMEHLIVKDFDNFALIQSQAEWIKSIIFGCRMPQKTRDYIRMNLDNSKVQFKESKENLSSLSVRRFF